MSMDENAKKVVDSIMEVINASEIYSFEEDPAPVFNILLKKWEQMLNFQHTDLPSGLRNRWKKLTSSDFTNCDSNMLLDIEKKVDDNIDQKEMTVLNSLINLLCRLDRSDNIEDMNLVLQVVGIQRLWMAFEDSFVENLAPIIKMLVEQYFEYSGKCADELAEPVNKVWNSICESSKDKTLELASIFEGKLSMFKSDDGLLLLDAALFFVKKYEASYYGCDRDNRPSITPWQLEEFIYNLKLDYVANKLWTIIDTAYPYSFKKEPLPVFQLLVDYYISNHTFETEIPAKWKMTLDELRNITQSCIDNTAKSLFKSFKETLSLVNLDEKLLAKIVDFFVEKYAELHRSEGGEFVLPEDLANFVYWIAVGVEGCTTELALYNPFAGLGTYGKTHAEKLRYQLNYQVEDAKDDLEEVESALETFKEHSWYHGVESDQTNRLIGSVRLLVNNPTNLNQMYIAAEDSLQDEIEGFTGGWAFIATPPIASTEVSSEKFVGVLTKLFDKFIEAEGMSDAYFVLPKSFCYDSAYAHLRNKVVSRCILRGVIDLPKEIFKSSIEAVIVHLNKLTSNYYVDHQTLFVDARTLIKDSKLDDSHLLDICIDGKRTPYCTESDSLTISQYHYCLLPELYIPKSIEKGADDISIRLGELISFADEDASKEREGLFITEDCFRNDFKVLFEEVKFEQQMVEKDDEKFIGELIVLTFMRNKFLISKIPQGSSFYLRNNQVALKVKNPSAFSIDYVISSILKNGILDRASLAMTGVDFSSTYHREKIINNILRTEIFVPLDKSNQEETISTLREKYEQDKLAEEEAEKKRFAHREASSDISHMLGTTFHKIEICLMKLEEIEEALPVVAQMKDCIEYMTRFIDSVGQNFSDLKNKRIGMVKTKVNDFINQYCAGWKNYGKNTFEVQYDSSIDNNTTFMIHEVLMKVLLDTLLDNVYRHGFDRVKSPNHKVKISTSYASMDNKKYVLLSVANNGKPFPKDFTIEKYISRGEYCGESGRTGLGGNHVYSIAKAHKGFINLTSDEEWNVIVEILLPVTYYNECSTDKFTAYEHTKECL